MEKEIAENIKAHVVNNRDNLCSLVKDLVMINTENIPPTGNEEAGQIFLMNWMKTNLGLNSRLIYLEDVKGLKEHQLFYPGKDYESRDYSGRPNLVSVIKGNGGGKTLILSGHIDTVPTGQDHWESGSPLSGLAREGKIYGRGSFDMKGGIAASLMAIKVLSQAGIKLKGDIIFETVVDEEHGGSNGTLVNRMEGYNGDGVIIPEPSSLRIYNAFLGFRIAHLKIRGNSGISFAGEKLLNPIEAAASILKSIGTFAEIRERSAPSVTEYDDNAERVPVYISKIKAGEFSLNVPMIVPELCTIEVYWLVLPGESQKKIEEEFLKFIQESTKELGEGYSVETEFRFRWMPGVKVDPECDIVQIVESVASSVLDKPVKTEGAPFPCDMFVFKEFGIPGVVIGPDGANAHGTDEYATIESLLSLTEIIAKSIIEFCDIV